MSQSKRSIHLNEAEIRAIYAEGEGAVVSLVTELLTRCAINPAGGSLSNNTAELEPRASLLVVQPNHHGMGEDFPG